MNAEIPTPSFYRDMVASVHASLVNIGLSEDISVAQKLADEFCEKHAYTTYHIPTLKYQKNVKRDRQIVEQSETMSAVAIAKNHGLTANFVRLIIRKARKAERIAS